jgi:hypothetical protein
VADGIYEPHPLVVELAAKLTKGAATPSQARTTFEAAVQAMKAVEASGAPTDSEQDALNKAATGLANEIANDPALPELHTFAGYLGGIVKDATNTTRTTWQLLYLDAKLRSWLLVGQESILLRKDVKDDTSPSGSRDHVWVKADASVSQGEGPPQKNEIQARFLRGDFVSAGDFAASVTGGTYAPVTGPMCPLTPGCCGRRTR